MNLSVALFLSAVESRAQNADEDPQADPAAAELVQQGIALRRSGKDEAALGVFLEAERQSPNSVRILLHVTAAAQATGRWLMAHQYLQKAAAFKNDPYYQRYRASIKTIEDAVNQHIGQFRVLGSPEGAEVLLNGEPVATLPMSNAKVVEAGSYALEVRKPGFYSLRRPLTIGGGGSLTQEAVDLRKQEAQAGQARAGAFGYGPDGGAVNGASPGGKGSSWVTWTLAGTAVALGATSGVAFVVREREADHWNDDSRCLDGTRTREDVCGGVRDRADTAEKVGVVSGILAAGFGGAAIIHWLWSSGDSSTNEAARPRATCDAGLGGILCHGTF